jgi:hypothetical protein
VDLEGTDRLSGPGESHIASGSKGIALLRPLLATRTACVCGVCQWTLIKSHGESTEHWQVPNCVWQTLLTVSALVGAECILSH